MANYQNQAIKSSLKKNYSVLKQALDRYQADHGERLISLDVSRLAIKENLVKYTNVMYDCGTGSLDETACIPNLYGEEGTSTVYKNFSGTSYIDLVYFDDGQFVLNDGSLILIERKDINDGLCYISVDVNGFGKKPNRLGKDLFMFQLMPNGELLPMGAKGTMYQEEDGYCSNTSNNPLNGAACTQKMLYE